MQIPQKRKLRVPKSLPFWIAVVLTMCIYFAGASGLQAGCMDLADVPIETQSMGAPGMIMFMYDNSGSMAFSVMCPEEEGSFHTPSNEDEYYGYCFLYDPDYNANDLETLQGSGDEMYWKSQWSGYNKIYYNPDVQYEPWPAWTTVPDVDTVPACSPLADPTNPLTDVVRDNNTFNLNATWASFNMGGSDELADVIDSSGIVVDNSDESAVAEIVMDDRDPGFSYTRNSWNWNFNNDPQYYNGNYMTYYGDTDPLPVSATWTFDINTAGNYEVWANVPKYSTRIRNADYTISHSSGDDTVTISQYDNRNDYPIWEKLGEYSFNSGTGAGQVTLNFTNTERNGRVSIGVDAMKLVPTFTAASDVLFSSTGGWAIYNSNDAVNNQYLYTDHPGTYTASWTANNLNSDTYYNVYVRWVAVSQRSTEVHYSLDGDPPVSFNQRNNNGQWMLLASHERFHSGSSTVTLAHTSTASGSDSDTDRACADAVAFLPTSDVPDSSATTTNIIIAHYFVKNDSGLFLVNLDGDFTYYQCNDSDDDGKIEDGELTKLTIDKAQAYGIVSGRTYEEERQNFANWFQFDRSRELIARYALATLVKSMGNIYFGLTTIPSRDIYAIRAIKEANVLDKDDTMTVLNQIYNLPTPSGGTPLKDGFQKVGDYFEGGASLVNNHDKEYFFAGGYSDADSYPYLNQANGGNCQQAFMIAMTDGYYNSNQGQNVGNYDGDNNTDWDGGEYGDTYSNTLADIAMNFYERDLKDDSILTDDVPTNPYDKNNTQHVVTYALGFGVDGSIDPISADWIDCPSATGDGQACGTWPEPVESTPTTIDDLYHATVNGRGMFLNASNPQQLVAALMKIKADIEARLGSASAVTTNSVQRQIGSKLYRGLYLTGKWSGDLLAYQIDAITGFTYSNPIWSAKDLLDSVSFENRKIYSFDGTNGTYFDFNSMTGDQKTRLADGLTYAFGTKASYTFGTIDMTDVENLVNYLKGDVSHDQAHGGVFRSRTDILGDVVHSEAEYRDKVLYLGTNDGMLHAFHSETGVELGAYIPNMLYSELPKLANPDYQHQYFIDNTAYTKIIGKQTLLVCPMGKGAKGLFMLDVSTPMGEADPSKVALWEYPDTGATDSDLGYTYSQATIMRTAVEYNDNGGWSVITGNGYDSTRGHAVLFVLDAYTGHVIRKIDTEAGNCNGLSSPAIIDQDEDGAIDLVYAGDMKGNMWKFDLSSDNAADWKVAYSDGVNPQPLFTATSSTSGVQPITNKPAVISMSACNPDLQGNLIIFGTGKYLGLSDPIDSSEQALYGIYDWGPDWDVKEGATVTNKYLGSLSVGSPRQMLTASAAAGATVTLLEQTLYESGEYRFVTNNDISYFNPDTLEGSHVGWYVTLPIQGERSVRRLNIVKDSVMVVTNIPNQSPCSAGGASYINFINACSAGIPEAPQIDVNGDYHFSDSDTVNGKNPTAGSAYDGILLDPTILDDIAYVNTSKVNDDGDGPGPGPGPGGGGPELKVNVDPPGAFFWRIIE